MKRVAAKFVQKLWNFEQKQRRMSVAQKSLNEVNNDAELLKRVITDNETRVYGYDVEIKTQSSQHSGSPRPKKARQVLSNVKVMLTVFSVFNSIVNCCHKVKRSIKNTIYKFNVVRVKQSEKNARICGKTICGFRATIMHLLLTLRCLFVNFWLKIKL